MRTEREGTQYGGRLWPEAPNTHSDDRRRASGVLKTKDGTSDIEQESNSSPRNPDEEERMQTESYAPPLPGAPQFRPRSKTNWIATFVAGGLGLIVAITLIFMLQSRSSELAMAQESLRASQSTLSSQSHRLEKARDNLSSTRASLSSTKSDLKGANGALRVSVRCATATLHAWYSTTNYSYTATGWALQRAVRSSACRIVHRAELTNSYGINS
jgi:cytoskeletal protein RodZ